LPNEFVFGAVAIYGGSAPTWSSGWSALTSYALGGNNLGRAQRITTEMGSFNATGTASGNWLAVCVTFR
jgi:hypothetical protein